jgi:YbbR domain-containing protein
MRRWFLENLGLKAMAFFIALALWAYVGSRQVLEQKMTLNLELTDIPAGMMVDSNVKTTIPVVFVGRKDAILKLDPDGLTAVVDLKDFAPTKKDMIVHPTVRVQPLPSGVTIPATTIAVHLIPVQSGQ